jgi:aminopeptidase N
MGFPLVEVVKRTPSADGKSTVLSLKQSWFLADGSEADGRTWTIPLTLVTASSTEEEKKQVVLMSEATMELTVPGSSLSDPKWWVKLNAEQHVPMRVAYDDVTGLAQVRTVVVMGRKKKGSSGTEHEEE